MATAAACRPAPTPIPAEPSRPSGTAEFSGDTQSRPGGVVVGAHGHHRTLTHAAYFGGAPFDLGGKDVAARDGDDLLGPPADHQTVVGEVAQISGREPGPGLQRG